jgi:prepilin-type N-terminal cleavage/methylation domain-containing protein
VVVSDSAWSIRGARRDRGISLVEMLVAVAVIGGAAGIVTTGARAAGPAATAVCAADEQALRAALVGWRIDHPQATNVDQDALVAAGLLSAPSRHWRVGEDLEPVPADPVCRGRS